MCCEAPLRLCVDVITEVSVSLKRKWMFEIIAPLRKDGNIQLFRMERKLDCKFKTSLVKRMIDRESERFCVLLTSNTILKVIFCVFRFSLVHLVLSRM